MLKFMVEKYGKKRQKQNPASRQGFAQKTI
jgi:hypothetical protein